MIYNYTKLLPKIKENHLISYNFRNFGTKRFGKMGDEFMKFKKLGKVLLTMGLAACMSMSMFACGTGDDTGNGGGATNVDQTPTKLDTPVVTVSGTTATWEAIENASGYEYSLDGGKTCIHLGSLISKLLSGNSISTLSKTSLKAFSVAFNKSSGITFTPYFSLSSLAKSILFCETSLQFKMITNGLPASFNLLATFSSAFI